MKNEDFSLKKGWKLMVDAYKQQTQGIKCMGFEFEEVLYLAPV
jgi:hypothetical protein